MHRKSTSFTLSELNSSQNINAKIPRNSSSEEIEGAVKEYWNPSGYQQIKARQILEDYKPSGLPKRLLITDYFQDQNLLSVMNKFKILNVRKNALEKHPLAPVPTSAEVEFHKSQSESFVSIFVPESQQKIKRGRSTHQPPVSQRPSLKKANDKSNARNKANREGGSLQRKPQRYNEGAKAPSREKSGSIDSSEGWSPLRRGFNVQGRQNQIVGNFIRMEALLNFIFLRENDPEPICLDFKPIEKLKRILLICYDVVIKATDLLSEITKRFWVLERTKGTPSDTLGSSIAIANQINLLNFLRTWVKERPEDFQNNEDLHGLLKKFLTSVSLKLKYDFAEAVRPTRSMLDKIKLIAKDVKPNSEVANNVSSGSSSCKQGQSSRLSAKTRSYFSHIHKELNMLSLQNIQEIFMIVPAFEIAKQFCLFDLGLASQIKLHHVRESSKHPSTSPLSQAGLHFNYFTLFLIFVFLKIEKKGAFISRLVCIANSLYELRNFQGFSIIMSALTHTMIVNEVNRILQEMDKDLHELKSGLEALFDKQTGYRTFKRTISQASFPMVPFMPLVIQDILRIDAFYEKSQTVQGDNDLSVNLDKMELMFDSYENVYLVKFSNYDFEPIQIFQDFLQYYYRETLFSSTQTQDVMEIEEVLFHLCKSNKSSISGS